MTGVCKLTKKSCIHMLFPFSILSVLFQLSRHNQSCYTVFSLQCLNQPALLIFQVCLSLSRTGSKIMVAHTVVSYTSKIL